MAIEVVCLALSSVTEKISSEVESSDGHLRCLLVQRGGQEILDKVAQGEAELSAFATFSNELVHCLTETIDAVAKRYRLNTSRREKLWVEFHQLRIDEKGKLQTLWKELLCKLCVTIDDPLLVQSLYAEVFSALMRNYFSSEAMERAQSIPSADGISPVELTSDELNAMRYACGYVARALLKKYETRHGEAYSQYVQCLGDMAVEGEGDDVLSYTRKWFDLVNRGGLFPLNESTFTLFIAIESRVRVILPQHVIGHSDKETFRRAVINQVVQDENVQFRWSLLSQDINKPEDAETLLTEIVTLWVTIRGFSVCASWMEEYKKITGKTTKKSAALRKSVTETAS